MRGDTNLVPTLRALPHVIHQVLGHLTQGPALLSVVDADAAAATLRLTDAFLDGVREVRTARADVGAKDVGG